MEVHLVHFAEGDAARAGAKVVIGVCFRKDEKVAVSEVGLGKLNKAMKARQRVESFSEEVAPAHFLPGHPDRWYRYDGSLTFGTFSEDVSWFVMAERKLVNPSDVDELERAAAQEPRGLQDLNHRIVLRSFDLKV